MKLRNGKNTEILPIPPDDEHVWEAKRLGRSLRRIHKLYGSVEHSHGVNRCAMSYGVKTGININQMFSLYINKYLTSTSS